MAPAQQSSTVSVPAELSLSSFRPCAKLSASDGPGSEHGNIRAPSEIARSARGEVELLPGVWHRRQHLGSLGAAPSSAGLSPNPNVLGCPSELQHAKTKKDNKPRAAVQLR
ncbi:hypothetical protein DL765_007738 [Monosporascus sp. GIB2]|nr:hypothetical protein DL765_007738 [Monosporascus sp. GIB2]